MKQLRMTLAGSAAVLALAAGAFAQPVVERSVKIEPGGIYEVAFNPADNDVYVAVAGPRGSESAYIVRLDGETLERVSEIDVSDTPFYGLALDVGAQVFYGTDTRGGFVPAVSVQTGETLAVLENTERAHVRQVLVDEDAGKVYVSEVGGRGDNTDPSRIWIIDASDHSLERIIEVEDHVLTGLALDAAGNRVFSTDMSSNEVVVIDLESGEIADRWAVGSESAINVFFDGEGERLFVTAQGTGDLTVLSSEDGSQIAKIETGEGALSVNYNPAVGQIYVANRRAGTVTVLDSESYEIIADLETGTFPQTIAIDTATNAVYVTNKARGLPRGAEPGTPVPDDPDGDTVTLIRP